LQSTDPKHHVIPILQHVLDHAQPDGSLSVDFKFGKGATFGRVFSGGVGYQSCTRDTRLFCSARFYVEDDIVNSFPTIMSQVFQSAGLYCPYLVDYVARREELFQELCTPRLNRDQLKKLFLRSLHGGCFRHKYDGYLPFLGGFESELKSCTEKLLQAPGYRHIRALLKKQELENKEPTKKKKKSVLGRAIALICQGVESRIMRAKTLFTQRNKLAVATDLFDAHLREIGFLDLDSCSRFVEAETGMKVQFVSKPGSHVWPSSDHESSPSFDPSSQIPVSTSLTTTTNQPKAFYPPHSSAFPHVTSSNNFDYNNSNSDINLNINNSDHRNDSDRFNYSCNNRNIVGSSFVSF
jgi:hypothetical protein